MADAERSFTAVPKTGGRGSPVADLPSKKSWFDLPDGTTGIVVLLMVSAICGGMIAVYWPFLQPGGESSVGDRLSTLETRVDEIAVGHASRAAMQVIAAQRREIAALKSRLDADEARLAVTEKSESAAEGVDLTTLKSNLDKAATDTRQIAARVSRDEQLGGPVGAQAMSQLRNDVDGRTTALHDKVSRFEQRLAALEKSAPPADLAQRLDSFALKNEEGVLETRIGELEAQDMTGVMRRAAAVMALADLVRASAGGEPFVDELAALKSLAPASPEIQDLARYAAKGAPTRTMLADSFSRQIDTILSSDHGNANGSWRDRILSGVINVVTMRPIRNIIGNDPEARVARAQVDLNLGEVARAVKEVNALPAAERAAAEPWLKSANERINVDRDARSLAQRLVANLSVQPNGTQVPGGAAPAR
jgi:hypothetical protein